MMNVFDPIKLDLNNSIKNKENYLNYISKKDNNNIEKVNSNKIISNTVKSYQTMKMFYRNISLSNVYRVYKKNTQIISNNNNNNFKLNKDNSISKLFNQETLIMPINNQKVSFEKFFDNFSKNSKLNKKNSCFICNRPENLRFNIKLYHTKNCKHFICLICGKYYYEGKIEQGIFDKKCPKFKCLEEYTKEEIKEMISKKFLEKMNKILTNSSSNQDKLKLTNKCKLYYLNNNVFDVVNIQSENLIKNYLELKNIVCKNCKESALFGRTMSTYIICLNCGEKFCKYCFKNYDGNHLNKNSKNYCKIYYRDLYGFKIKIKQKKIYIIGYIIVSYIILLIGMTKNFTNFFFKKEKYNFLYIIMFILILFINMFFLILITPYYPIIINICD
jgi:hypothetical protein